MTNLKLKIDMHCASCAGNIEKVLKKLNVKNAVANPALKILKCEYDETKISKNEIIKAINNIGYNIVG